MIASTEALAPYGYYFHRQKVARGIGAGRGKGTRGDSASTQLN